MSEAKKESRSQSYIKKLIHPVAIGTYITLTLSTIAHLYYEDRGRVSHQTTDHYSQFITLIDSFDQKSIDWRFRWRGPRPADSNVAVLAVDDRSLDIVGRWPWPRDIMGRALDNAFKNGAKVIATDIIWSEPSDRPEIRLIDDLSKKNILPGELTTTIKQNLDAYDPDKAFAQSIAANKDKLILGNIFLESYPWQDRELDSGYTNLCHDLIIEGGPLKAIVDKQALPFVILNKEVVLPDIFAEAYKSQLQEIETQYRASHPTPKTAFESYQIDADVLNEKIKFCDEVFLNPEQDDFVKNITENWDEIKKAVPDLEFSSSFDEWLLAFKSNNLVNAVTESVRWTLTIPLLADSAEHFGYFNAILDQDGTIRRSPLLARAGSYYLPSIALQAYLLALGNNHHIEVTIEPKPDLLVKGIDRMYVADEDAKPVLDLPVSVEGKMLVNYAGPGRMIPHASIADLLNEGNPDIEVKFRKFSKKHGWQETTEKFKKAEFLKDKVMVVGATAIGVYDLRVTPFDENFPGVETHANVIDNLLRRDFLATVPKKEVWMPLGMLILGLALSFALAHFGAVSGLICSSVLTLSLIGIDNYFLFKNGILVSILLPTFQVPFTYVFLTFYKYLTEERSKKELRATFSKYVAPAIVEEILKDPKNLELGGRKERVTVFFSDVRGFTTISEKLDPRALSDLLNSYLTPMTELVFKNQGTLDKYMGDAIMAFFGAPVHYNNHAKMACRCALQNLEKLKELQAIYEKKGLPQIDVGIGLNTGECSVGNMGSESVRSYTVMGDAVNLASRLEGINKTYGTHIIISEFTHADVKDDFLCREVDWVRVKGKLQPVKIFELIAEGQGEKHLVEMAKCFNQGYAHYHKKEFAEAVALFEQAVKHNPLDETSKIYIERCQEFMAEPPPADWDGVYVMKTK